MFDDRDLRFDLCALCLLALTMFLGLSLLTYSPADPLGEALFPLNRVYQAHQVEYPTNVTIQNACGHAGALCADMLLGLFGIGAYVVVLCMAIVDASMLLRKTIDGAATRLVGLLAALVGSLTIIQMFLPEIGVGPAIGPGGIIGAVGRTFLEQHFATAGSVILLSSLTLGGVLLCTDYVLLQVVVLAATALLNMTPRMRRNIFAAWKTRLAARRAAARSTREDAEDEEFEEDAEEEFEEELPRVRTNRHLNDLNQFEQGLDVEDDPNTEEEAEYEEEYEYEYEDEEDETADPEQAEAVKSEDALVGAPVSSKRKQRAAEREEVIAQLEEASREYDPQDYELPPWSLLRAAESYDPTELLKECQRKSRLLEKTFEDFKLDVKVRDIETGPVIAQYEVALKRGLRLSKITSLEDDLAIALRVPSVRVVAPIPGKNTVGIEVPNDERQIVRMREVMEEAGSHVKKMALPIFLGKDASGTPLAVDLARMPHLLIAGRTGTGKSVCLNSIISSMLMTKTPDDVRMLMIDPKMVELSGYARLPHLMHPVVTDMRKAEAILAWACEKMDERYRLLANAGVRHLASYNQLGEEELMARLQPETEDDKKLIPRHLPYIVIIADEMADLMMTAGKEVQAHIIRLASKSRAVGIHLILATQRPTADVITGLIKSNLPARIAFQVASGLDSRVVLDENGADRLLGNGDMLFVSPGTSSLLRGQGTYMSDDEIDRIVDYCSSKGEQRFVKELVQLKVEDKEADGEAVPLKNRDDLYDQAIEIVIREGRGSVSLLQRNLQIGYGRAARLIDFMAEDGIVGAYNGSQAREVLMTLADLEASRAAEAGVASSAPATPAAAGQVLKPTVVQVLPAPAENDEDQELYEEETGEACVRVDDAQTAELEADEYEDDDEEDDYEEDDYEEDDYEEDEAEGDVEEGELEHEAEGELDVELEAGHDSEEEYVDVEDEHENDDELDDEEYEEEEEFNEAYADGEVYEDVDGDGFDAESYADDELEQDDDEVTDEIAVLEADSEDANPASLDDSSSDVAAVKKGLVPKVKTRSRPSKRPIDSSEADEPRRERRPGDVRKRGSHNRLKKHRIHPSHVE